MAIRHGYYMLCQVQYQTLYLIHTRNIVWASGLCIILSAKIWMNKVISLDKSLIFGL